MSITKAHLGPSVELSAIIIRACNKCGGKREIGRACASCGNRELAQYDDVGVIAATNTSRWKRLKWNIWGHRAANRRISKINKEMIVSQTTSQ